MRPLTLDDLLPLSEYTSRRREFFESHTRYIDRYRRVRIGPLVTLLFQNRQTLWFKVQELIRVARLVDPSQIQSALDLYNHLLPVKDSLQAALLPGTSELDRWADLAGESVRLCIGSTRVPAQVLTCRPEDRCEGTVHWVQFPVPSETRCGLQDAARQVYFEVTHGDYQHQSPAVSEEVRQSLLDDLATPLAA